MSIDLGHVLNIADSQYTTCAYDNDIKSLANQSFLARVKSTQPCRYGKSTVAAAADTPLHSINIYPNEWGDQRWRRAEDINLPGTNIRAAPIGARTDH
ncbi:hypothetical protein EVAR_27883_1 [Eumeta japonica]|uniref:Uncharacterized protein n=1 Tax=Eumeta variegata TaxID=151549 RepID=A0A4C1UUW5_EUMVA|nr:hypothetical protein EVAR_27883_1 [Eumeta japonica]